MSPKNSFEGADGAQITFVEYYKKRYNLEISDPNQFLLVSLNKRTG